MTAYSGPKIPEGITIAGEGDEMIATATDAEGKPVSEPLPNPPAGFIIEGEGDEMRAVETDAEGNPVEPSTRDDLVPGTPPIDTTL